MSERNEIILDPEPLEYGLQVAVHFGSKYHADLIVAAIAALPQLIEIAEAATAVVLYDWSENDDDAAWTIDRLRAVGELESA